MSEGVEAIPCGEGRSLSWKWSGNADPEIVVFHNGTRASVTLDRDARDRLMVLMLKYEMGNPRPRVRRRIRPKPMRDLESFKALRTAQFVIVDKRENADG